MKDPNQNYLNKGFPNRTAYLKGMSERFGFSLSFAQDLATYFSEKNFEILDSTLRNLGDDKYENFIIPNYTLKICAN